MILDLVVNMSDDGCTAEIPGLKGCEAWAHTEDDAINKAVEMAVFYLKLNSKKDIKIDRARTGRNKIIYKLIFSKPAAK